METRPGFRQGMAIVLDLRSKPDRLVRAIERVFELSAGKLLDLDRSWDLMRGTPVFTVNGAYTSRGWTEWTQGFVHGAHLLQFDATGEFRFLDLGRKGTMERMSHHLTHIGVHDHGFNNISTYGNLWRLMREGKAPSTDGDKHYCELALKVSGAVQAARWTDLPQGRGYIYSFNGPHSLFVDTVRSLRSLAVAHQLGHALMGERDRRFSLLQRLLRHALTTADFNVYYGKGRDGYDLAGRTAHESIFNLNDGSYRCPSSQQGYSPFTTWTRGLAWAILGFAEQAEFLLTFSDAEIEAVLSAAALENEPPETWPKTGVAVRARLIEAASVTAEYYMATCCTDGIPMWDTGAPNLHHIAGWQDRPSDPWNGREPVDSSAAAIAAQGLWRLGGYLIANDAGASGARYRHAALTIAKTLFAEPYLAVDTGHQGLLLHTVYHRPNGWDYVVPGQKIPNGESCMWGDYHMLELALMLWRETRGEAYLAFFDFTRRRPAG